MTAPKLICVCLSVVCDNKFFRLESQWLQKRDLPSAQFEKQPTKAENLKPAIFRLPFSYLPLWCLITQPTLLAIFDVRYLVELLYYLLSLVIRPFLPSNRWLRKHPSLHIAAIIYLTHTTSTSQYGQRTTLAPIFKQARTIVDPRTRTQASTWLV